MAHLSAGLDRPWRVGCLCVHGGGKVEQNVDYELWYIMHEPANLPDSPAAAACSAGLCVFSAHRCRWWLRMRCQGCVATQLQHQNYYVKDLTCNPHVRVVNDN